MFNSLNVFRAALAAATTVLPLGVMAEQTSVVLVHGAFSDGSAWHKVIPILQEAGVPVSAAQLPMSSLQEDVDAVTRLIDRQEGPVVLVGHSYGGTVITQAGAEDGVEAMVYVAAFALEAGQSLMTLIEGQPPAPWQAELLVDEAGYIRLSPAGVATYFAQDLPAEEAALIAATQGPLQYKINYEAPNVAAWTTHPSFYVLAENDQIIPPQLQGYFAQRMGAEVVTVPSSHVPMLSQPEVVGEVILDAVAAVSDD